MTRSVYIFLCKRQLTIPTLWRRALPQSISLELQNPVVKDNGTPNTRFNEVSTTYIDQLRRQTRERRQYVYAKSLEAQERQIWERKQRVKDALATGKSLPTELRKDAEKLGKDLPFDEAQSGVYPS